MAQHASVTGAAGDAWPEDAGPRVSVPRRHVPPQLAAARDELFDDADRHGPRWPVLARRISPALALTAAMVALASSTHWRSLVIGHASATGADLVLVGPVLAAIVFLAAACAPLARARVEPLLGAGLALLAGSLWLVSRGWIVAAVVPAALAAVLLGVSAARAMRRVVWTLPVLLAAGVSDAHSVDGGATHRLLQGVTTGASDATRVAPVLRVPPALIQHVDLLVLHIPAATGTWLLGMVDVVALGMLLGLAHLYWLPLRRTTVALGGALASTVLLGIPVPVLPLLGVVWVLVHARLVWRATRFSLRRLTYLGG
jgi:hypothetical protein